VLDPKHDGYDDGGVADLTLLIDLEDHVLRRKRGENAYFSAVKADLLPRVTSGQFATLPRRDQKVQLATLLFSDGDARMEDGSNDDEGPNPSEIYRENMDRDDPEVQKRREERLLKSKKALKLSNYLREPACTAMALGEISKRILTLYGKDQAEAALRCADKALLMASDKYYDNDEMTIEVSSSHRNVLIMFFAAGRQKHATLTFSSASTILLGDEQTMMNGFCSSRVL